MQRKLGLHSQLQKYIQASASKFVEGAMLPCHVKWTLPFCLISYTEVRALTHENMLKYAYLIIYILLQLL